MGCGSPGARLRRRLVRFTDGEHYWFRKGLLRRLHARREDYTEQHRHQRAVHNRNRQQRRLPVFAAPARHLFADRRSGGFKKASIADVLVQVDQITHVDVGLEIGSQTDVMEVFGAVPLLEADKSTLSHVVENRAIASMPLNARQFLDLARLTPGASPLPPGHWAASRWPVHVPNRTCI